MKRILSILFCMLLLAACQPTPQAEVIPNKGDDPLQAVIEENGAGFSAEAYRTDLLQRWEGTVETVQVPYRLRSM